MCTIHESDQDPQQQNDQESSAQTALDSQKDSECSHMALIHSQTSSQTPAVKVFTGKSVTPILPSLLFVIVISINIKETKSQIQNRQTHIFHSFQYSKLGSSLGWNGDMVNVLTV